MIVFSASMLSRERGVDVRDVGNEVVVVLDVKAQSAMLSSSGTRPTFVVTVID